MAYLYGILSALFFGISNVYWKDASKRIDYPYLIVFRGLIASTLFTLLWFFLFVCDDENVQLIQPSTNPQFYLIAICICFICSLGICFFLASLRYQTVSLTVSLASINIFNLLTAVLVVGEAFRSVYWICFSLAGIGVLFTQDISFKCNLLQWNKGATYALMAAFFWGITYPLFKFLSTTLGAIPLACMLEICVTVSALIWARLERKEFNTIILLQKSNLITYFILALLLIGGTLFFNLAIQHVTILNLDLIANLQLIVALLASIIIYQEKLSIKQLVGIVLILLSIFLSQMF